MRRRALTLAFPCAFVASTAAAQDGTPDLVKSALWVAAATIVAAVSKRIVDALSKKEDTAYQLALQELNAEKAERTRDRQIWELERAKMEERLARLEVEVRSLQRQLRSARAAAAYRQGVQEAVGVKVPDKPDDSEEIDDFLDETLGQIESS
jgi:uncharacterized protein YdaU (DUF1376 family)